MPRSLRRRLLDAVDGDETRIDWERVESVATRRRGVPIRVSFPRTSSSMTDSVTP